MEPGFAVEQKELKRMAAVLQELGLSYAETVEVMNEMAKDVNNAKKLWRDGYKSKLIKIAVALITFPEPTPISESMGAVVLAAGLIQNRIKKSTLHVEDVYKTFQDVNNDILKIRQLRT
jgi:signal recognition particle subunit SEC65